MNVRANVIVYNVLSMLIFIEVELNFGLKENQYQNKLYQILNFIFSTTFLETKHCPYSKFVSFGGVNNYLDDCMWPYVCIVGTNCALYPIAQCERHIESC